MPESSNLVFCGTPRFAVPTLEKLVDAGFTVDLVVTQPDKPRGRGMELAPSPVKQRSLELGLLPLGLASEVKLTRDVAEGEALRWSDVACDENDHAVKVRREMEAAFARPNAAV